AWGWGLQGGSRLWVLEAPRSLCAHACAQTGAGMFTPVSPGRPKDYALPNASWSRDMLDLYDRFLAMTKEGLWKRIPSYNNVLDHIPGKALRGLPSRKKDTRLFLRSIEAEGVGFEYVMFLNSSEKRVVCLFQPGSYLEGHPGFAHGGSIATIIDSTIGSCAIFVAGRVMTANLSINYMSPVPLGSVVLVDSKVDKVEGRKVFLSCKVQSVDGGTLHAEATGKDRVQVAQGVCKRVGVGLC
uniref:Acyl-coenzyme A thioesterase THEM4 n=1 Tax=Dromaius novaehollandiae TaxID=8790 RepID=A0A8C4KNC7_DRONO